MSTLARRGAGVLRFEGRIGNVAPMQDDNGKRDERNETEGGPA